MKKFLLFSLLFYLTMAKILAEPIIISPVSKISTCDKYLQVGNTYDFKNVNNGEKITGMVLYYRPNGVMGQEAQLEIGNFRNSQGKYISGTISIVPINHKHFQEFMNFYNSPFFSFVRGSEIILTPEQNFTINNAKGDNAFLVIKIRPKQIISTVHDEIESNDIVEFVTVDDVYQERNLFIKANTPVYGIVDNVYDNGYVGDNAKIEFKKFIVYDIFQSKHVINTDLSIDGFDILKYKSKRFAQFFNYIGIIFRGKEVDIKDYDINVSFNIVF